MGCVGRVCRGQSWAFHRIQWAGASQDRDTDSAIHRVVSGSRRLSPGRVSLRLDHRWAISRPSSRCWIEPESLYTERTDVDDAALAIEIAEDDGPKNFGYGRFTSIWGFDSGGALAWVGAWE